MSIATDDFHTNRLYQLLVNQSNYSNELLKEVNSILHEQPELAHISHSIEGSYFHIVCQNANEQDNIAYRLIYALSNAGANPNITNANGNTPLHEALMRDFHDVGVNLIQALFRIGVDQRIVNKQGKTANAYLEDNPQLTALYQGYGEGIWAAIETSNIQETERLIKGFIKVDCKHTDETNLLEKARELNCLPLIRILANYQVTIEFIHSILACDWERVELIHQYEGKFIKLNLVDSLHTLTWIRTTNRTYNKSLMEISLDTQSSELFDLLFNSAIFKSKIDVNIMCTDGYPFYFHMFDKCFSNDIRKEIYSNANFHMKSSKGETFLFHLVHLYGQNEMKEYVEIFEEIAMNQPLLLTQRNEQGRTIIDEIELTTALTYHKWRIFDEKIKEILFNQLKMNVNIERYVMNGFGYHLLLLLTDENVPMNKTCQDLIQSLRFRQGLPALMNEFAQTIFNDELGKMEKILRIKSNICFAKDWSGRTCAHLAVLYRRKEILSYICENHNHVINMKDNLNRTPWHYACIMNDEAIIRILQKGNAKKIVDCLNLSPDDYRSNRDLCSEEFHAQDFPRNELDKRLEGRSDYLKLSFYFPLKKSIEENAVEDIKSINQEMNTMGFYLEDFNSDSYVNDWLRGQRYIPLLFLALESRSISAIQCLIELGLPLSGRMYLSKSTNNQNSRCVSFRTRAEELECFDIIGMINDLEDDSELKNIFKRHLSPPGTSSDLSSTESAQPAKRQNRLSEGTANNRYDNSKSQACILL